MTRAEYQSRMNDLIDDMARAEFEARKAKAASDAAWDAMVELDRANPGWAFLESGEPTAAEATYDRMGA